MIYFLNNIGLKDKNDDTILLNGQIKRNCNGLINCDCFQAGVFDGVGGNQAGDVASNFMAEKFIEFSKSNNLDEILAKMVIYNQELIELSKQKESCEGMATTMAYLQKIDEQMFVANVGDSKIFRFRNNILWQISNDDIPLDNPNAHIITRCFGINLTKDNIHYNCCDVRKNDVFILCSDGISDIINCDCLETILTESQSLLEIIEKVNKIINESQMYDNYSLIIIKEG